MIGGNDCRRSLRDNSLLCGAVSKDAIRDHLSLQAITICINYSDFLRCTIENRKHFARWIILTVEEDSTTRMLCKSSGLECMTSRVLRKDGSDFNAAWNKARAINEVIDQLDQRGWVVIIDADVLLPRTFLSRVAAIPLQPGTVYGLKGRRICRSARSFEILRGCEPWDNAADRNTQPLGYFQLFNLSSWPNRYPELPFDRTRRHDDQSFVELFSPERRELLPIVALHAGEFGANWNSRISEAYGLPDSRSTSLETARDLEEMIDDQCGTLPVVAMIGYYPGPLLATFAQRSERIHLFDHYGISQGGFTRTDKHDRAALRLLVDDLLKQTANVEFTGVHCASNVSRIPERSIDVLYVSGGISGISEMLSEAVPQWMSKLKPEAIVCGDMFFASEWAEGIAAITVLFGTPDHVAHSGFWWKRIVGPNALCVSDIYQEGGKEDCIVVLNENGDENLEALLLTLHSVRLHWKGPIALLHYGEWEYSLLLACRRLGCSFHHQGPKITNITSERIESLLESRTSSSRRVLLLWGGALVCAPLHTLFRSELKDSGGIAYGSPLLVQASPRAAAAVHPAYIGDCRSAEKLWPIMVYDREPHTWTDASWENWTAMKISMLELFQCSIRVRPSSTIVFIVTSDSFGDLQQRWPGMKFPHETQVLVIAVGEGLEDIWLPGSREPRELVYISVTSMLPRAIFDEIQRRITTEYVVFIAPNATPIPGSELFLGPDWDHCDIAFHMTANAIMEPKVTGNCFVPVDFSGMMHITFLRSLISEFALESDSTRDIAPLLYRIMQSGFCEPSRCRYVDMREFGWEIPQCFQYLSEVRFAGSGHPRRSVCKASFGVFLAD